MPINVAVCNHSTPLGRVQCYMWPMRTRIFLRFSQEKQNHSLLATLDADDLAQVEELEHG